MCDYDRLLVTCVLLSQKSCDKAADPCSKVQVCTLN